MAAAMWARWSGPTYRWRLGAVAAAALVAAGSVVALVGAVGPDVGVDRSSSRHIPTRSALDARPSTGDGFASAPNASGGSTAASAQDKAVGVPEPMPPVVDSGGRVTASEPQIVRTAQLVLRVRDGSFERAVGRADTIAVGAGGFVVSTNTSSFEKGQAAGDLVLRIPAAAFDRVRGELRNLGDIESLTQSGDDVSSQLVDLDARLRTLRAEESALQAILAKAATINDTLQVRDRLTGVRTQIEQLAAEQASLKDRVTYATITLSLHEGSTDGLPQPVEKDGSGILHSFRTAANATVAVAGGMVIVLGALLPFALLALVAWVIHRRYGRRHAEAG